MPANKPVYYWDTSIFFAWLKNESRPNGEMNGVVEVVEKVQANRATIITSDQFQMETLPVSMTPQVRTKLDDVFKRRNVQMKRIDRRVVTIAQEIRNFYQQEKLAGRLTKKGLITTADTTHLATAIVYGVDQFHTFDDGGKDSWSLLDLDGNVAGYPLVVCKPPFSQFRFDL